MTPQEEKYLQEVEDRKELGIAIIVVVLLAVFFIGIMALIEIVR